MQIEAEGEIATASTLARMLSNIPLARGGPASIVIFDIHALQVRFPCLMFATQLLCCCLAARQLAACALLKACLSLVMPRVHVP